MRRDLQARRRHFFNKRVSLVNYVAPDTKPEEMLTDDSATATVRQLGDALTEMEVNGHFFGQCSLTVVLNGHDARAVQRYGSGCSVWLRRAGSTSRCGAPHRAFLGE